MFAAPPDMQSFAADRAGHSRRGTRCAWGLALVVAAVIDGAAHAGEPLAASKGSATSFGALYEQAANDREAGLIVPVSAEQVEADTMAAAPPADSTSARAIDQADVAANAQDPLSRLRLPSSASQFDPAQTLKDWAEGAGLLIAFGIVSLWLVRQWVTRQEGAGGPTAHLRTIESLSLPQRCRIHLVDVDGRQVLVAVDASGIKSVTPLPDRFASLLESADGPTQPVGARVTEEDATRHVWDARQDTRLT